MTEEQREAQEQYCDGLVKCLAVTKACNAQLEEVEKTLREDYALDFEETFATIGEELDFIEEQIEVKMREVKR